ncbi:MAG: hypothetical protein ABSB39_19450 [Candidatus Sulfotelmatobacter sp.]|jgi:hypothetical protein
MAEFTCTRHGDQANELVLYWRRQTKREVKARSWFMAALALGSALEAMMYAYFIIWSGDDGNDPTRDEKVPDDLVLFDLIEAAKQIDLLSSVKFKDKFGEHAVEDVITEIRHMRNNVHAGVALRRNFNPAKFKKRDYMRLQGILDAVLDNYNRNL